LLSARITTAAQAPGYHALVFREPDKERLVSAGFLPCLCQHWRAPAISPHICLSGISPAGISLFGIFPVL
jgi:hypothetical protein